MKTIILALALAGFVHGATMTWQNSYTLSETTWGFSSGGGELTGVGVNVPRFDPSLGTLTGFILQGTVTAIADITLDVLNAPGDYSGYFGIKLRFYDIKPREDIAILESSPFEIVGAAAFSTHSFPGLFNDSVAIGHGCGSNNLISCLVEHTGTGTYRYQLRPELFRDIDGPYLTPYTATGSVTADLTATYTYEPAMTHMPEPSSWALMAAGLGGLAYYRRRQ
jgi:hypothetical protein